VENLRQKLNEASETITILAEYEKKVKVKQLETDVAEFLRNLDDRDVDLDEDTVKGVIDAFPNALKHHNEKQADTDRPDNYFPVQWLMRNSTHGLSFAPLLASEGIRRKKFSEEENGGLTFMNGPQNSNGCITKFLQSDGSRMLRERLGMEEDDYLRKLNDKDDTDFLALVNESNAAHDEKATSALKRLFELNIFQKQDVIDVGMIVYSSSGDHSKKRLQYVLSVCPEGLRPRGLYLLHYPICTRDKYRFGAILKAGLQYYPRQLGFLFKKPKGSRQRFIDMAMSSGWLGLSPDEIFKMIHDGIPPSNVNASSNPHPILHDVIRLAPKYTSLFWRYYPDSIFLRDDDTGRLPLHVALQNAAKWSMPLHSLITINDPIDRHEKDPVTGLYSFMSAASASGRGRGRGNNDLNVIYYLLRRDPNAWEGFQV